MGAAEFDQPLHYEIYHLRIAQRQLRPLLRPAAFAIYQRIVFRMRLGEFPRRNQPVKRMSPHILEESVRRLRPADLRGPEQIAATAAGGHQHAAQPFVHRLVGTHALVAAGSKSTIGKCRSFTVGDGYRLAVWISLGEVESYKWTRSYYTKGLLEHFVNTIQNTAR